jgi:hypothetical protein
MASASVNVPIKTTSAPTAAASATPSKPVEMNTLETTKPAEAGSTALPTDASILSSSISISPEVDSQREIQQSTDATVPVATTKDTTTSPASASQQSQVPVSSTTAGVAAASIATLEVPAATATELTHADNAPIGPDTDTPLNTALTTPPDMANPVCVITLLLTSGARHPYKLDEKYLTKRNVEVPGVTEDGKKDPFSISVYTLKELILREWREEWEAQPSSPSSIRLIHFGRLLDDKIPLKGKLPPHHPLVLRHIFVSR